MPSPAARPRRISPHEPLGRIAALVRAKTGIAATESRLEAQEREIFRLVKHAGMDSIEQFAERVANDQPLLWQLVDLLTVNESYFFRDTAHFEQVSGVILPDLRAHWRGPRAVRAWCAGCSTGEEAYSLAITFEEINPTPDYRIVATDICETALRKARAGVYSKWSLRSGARPIAPRFVKILRSQVRVASFLKRNIDFSFHNLADPDLPGHLSGQDMIFLRNVLIYFDRPAIARVTELVAAALNPGGWLITGPSDPIIDHPQLEVVRTPSAIYYRRRQNDGGAWVSTQTTAEPILRSAPSPVLDAAIPSTSEPVAPPKLVKTPPAVAPAADAGKSDLNELRRLRAAGMLDEVVRHTEADGLDAPAAALRVEALANLNRTGLALKEAERLTAIYPFDMRLLYLHTLLLLRADQREAALGACRRLIYLNPHAATPYLLLSEICVLGGDFAGAERACQNAILVLADNPQADDLKDLSHDSVADLAAYARQRFTELKARKDACHGA